MSYGEKIQHARALLKEAQEEADGAGDYVNGDEVGYALAFCRSAGIIAGGLDSVRERVKTPSRGRLARRKLGPPPMGPGT